MCNIKSSIVKDTETIDIKIVKIISDGLILESYIVHVYKKNVEIQNIQKKLFFNFRYLKILSDLANSFLQLSQTGILK